MNDSMFQKLTEDVRLQVKRLEKLDIYTNKHVHNVPKITLKICQKLNVSEEKTRFYINCAYLHDIGNGINRVDHAHTGAILAYQILKDIGMDLKDRTEIMSAIGNHDEQTGTAVSDISAALILADKSDVHRDRVVNKNIATFDIHDRVNYAVTIHIYLSPIKLEK